MPLNPEEFTFIKQLNRRLADRALEPTDSDREPIHDRPGMVDPVTMMMNCIALSDVQTLQLFSGFAGAGKTTELLRLQRTLEAAGYIVLYADASDYVNFVEPLPIADMLMVAAGAFNDSLRDNQQIDLLQRDWWQRLTDFVGRVDFHIPSAEGKLEYTSPGQSVLGGIKAGLSIKAELKTGSNFRQNLSNLLAAKLTELQKEVHKFFEDGVAELQRRHGPDTQVVFILDQLEQLRGDYRNWQSVIRAAAQAFTVHLPRLNVPYVHCVYAAPAWLQFVKPKPPTMVLLSGVPLSQRGTDRKPYQNGRALLRSLVNRRMDRNDAERLFGSGALDDGGPVERLILASGGHIRDLLLMLRNVLIRTTSLPVEPYVLDHVIAAASDAFKPIALDEARLLHDVAEKQNLEPETLDEASIEQLSNLFNGHSLMFYRNSYEWYDVHPLIRDEVERIVLDSKASDA
jgi:hypothetical protein